MYAFILMTMLWHVEKPPYPPIRVHYAPIPAAERYEARYHY